MNLYFCCSTENDLYRVISECDQSYPRYSTPAEAVERAANGSAVLLLADGYPDSHTEIDSATFQKAAEKNLRMYLEYPTSVPGIELGEVETTQWERVVVSSDAFGDSLPMHRIVAVHDCHFLTVSRVQDPLMVVARVAGYDTAVYGIPETASPILFEIPEHNLLIATTKLSNFITGRYAPTRAWKTIWEGVLSMLDPESDIPALHWQPTVHPAFGPDDALPSDAEKRSLESAARWFREGRVMIHTSYWPKVEEMILSGFETAPAPGPEVPHGDGSLGMLEGYASEIKHDGNQVQRLPIRSDCHGEAAMVLALDGTVNGQEESGRIASNILDFIYFNSDMQGGDRGNPRHPAFGHIAWGTISPAWEVANYGDDDARVILGTMAAAACLGSDKWDAGMFKSLLANLRTTGKYGFRGERIDMPEISRNGWKFYRDSETVHCAPHFESYLWACNLWAYDKTGCESFIERTRNAIRMTMESYPDGWRWANGIAQERARMLLCLAWLVRVEDTPEHRGWLKKMATLVLVNQEPCGAIREELGSGQSWAGSPKTNEAYGTGETPLIQENGDPASDQLYTSGFALLGLHEAAAATNDPEMAAAEDKLVDYLLRIQVRSQKYPYLDGAWFRAFDFKEWDYWASSADIGWGAWSIESGWSNSWIAAILGMRIKGTSLWDLTKNSRIKSRFEEVSELMAMNDGGATSECGL